MRDVISFVHMSLDGFVGGPKGELDWINHDDEIFHFVSERFQDVGAALYGRTTYQMMEGYWPTIPKNPKSTPQELHHANWVERIQKVVFSRSLEKVTWNNTTLIKDNIAEEVMKLKQQPGGDLMIFGSPGFTHSLLGLGLVDAFFINVNPILVGEGIPIFRNIKEQRKLRLVHTKTFRSGVQWLQYRRAELS